jgi:hypothetical protein
MEKTLARELAALKVAISRITCLLFCFVCFCPPRDKYPLVFLFRDQIPASTLHVSDTRTVMQVKQGLISLFRRLHQVIMDCSSGFHSTRQLCRRFCCLVAQLSNYQYPWIGTIGRRF